MTTISSEPKTQHHAPANAVDSANPLVAAEYKALRDEILKRVEFRYQLLNITLISAGTLLGAGLNANSAPVLLVYPILAAFLAGGVARSARSRPRQTRPLFVNMLLATASIIFTGPRLRAWAP